MKTAAFLIALLSSVIAASPIASTTNAAAMSSAQEDNLFARKEAFINERAALARGPEERGYAGAGKELERRDGRMAREERGFEGHVDERGRDKKKGRVEGHKGKGKGKGEKSVKSAE